MKPVRSLPQVIEMLPNCPNWYKKSALSASYLSELVGKRPFCGCIEFNCDLVQILITLSSSNKPTSPR